MRMFALLLFFVLSGFTTPVAEEVKLVYSFQVGDEYTLIQSTNQTIKQTIMGTEQNGDNKYSGTMKLRVVDVTGSGAKVECQFLALKNSSKNLMGEVTMDSESTEETTQNKIFKAMVKKTFFFFMNKNGLVERVEGAENLWSDIDKLGLDENTLGTMKQSLNQMMSPGSLKNSIGQALVYYPDNKIKPGDRWTSKGDFPMDFPIRIDNAWSLVNATHAVANLNAEGTYTTTDKEKTIALQGGITAKVDLGGKQTMKAAVNARTGWPTELSIHSRLIGKMTLLAGGMLPTDMDMPMEILTETMYKFVKK